MPGSVENIFDILWHVVVAIVIMIAAALTIVAVTASDNIFL